MTARTDLAPTRTEPLPVRVDTGRDRIAVLVGGREVAYGRRDEDRPGAWMHWNGRSEPYRVDGRTNCLNLLHDIASQWQRREQSLWRPGHGEPDQYGYMPTVPAGIVCVGCGDPLGGSRWASPVIYSSAVETTVHYECDNCSIWHDGEEDDDA